MLLLNKLMQRQGGCKCCSRFLEHKNGRQSRSTGAAVSDVNHSTGQVRSDVPKTAGAQHLLLGVRLRRVRVGGGGCQRKQHRNQFVLCDDRGRESGSR